MLLPDAAAEHVERDWGHVKGARAAEGEKGGGGYPMVTSPCASLGLKRKVSGL